MSVAEQSVANVPVAKRQRRVPELVSMPLAFLLAAACFVHFGVTAEAFISAIFSVLSRSSCLRRTASGFSTIASTSVRTSSA